MKRLTKAAQQRVLANIDIAQMEAKIAYSTRSIIPYNELLGSAYYALCTVALKPYSGERFRKVARIACRRQISKDRVRLNRQHIGKYPIIREIADEVFDVPDALSRLIVTEELIRVFSALPSLDRRPRQVLSYILNGITMGEIATILQVRQQTVSEHHLRGVTRLKKKLSPK